MTPAQSTPVCFRTDVNDFFSTMQSSSEPGSLLILVCDSEGGLDAKDVTVSLQLKLLRSDIAGLKMRLRENEHDLSLGRNRS